MPKYRKLYVKTCESLDINDMPDDFTRLMWVLLPLGLCREGRGMDNPTWLRSKLFPLRNDVTLEQIASAMDWFSQRGMLRRYECSGRRYFFVPTFHDYQGTTTREADSIYPSPPEEVIPDSRQTPDPLATGSSTDAVFNTQYADADKESAQTPPATAGHPDNGPTTFQEWQDKIRESDNRVATLREMCEVLYPGLDPPEFSYIGKVAKRLHAGRLADLLWQCASHPPTGDLLAYIQGVAKNGNHSGKRQPNPQEPAVVTGWEDT